MKQRGYSPCAFAQLSQFFVNLPAPARGSGRGLSSLASPKGKSRFSLANTGVWRVFPLLLQGATDRAGIIFCGPMRWFCGHPGTVVHKDIPIAVMHRIKSFGFKNPVCFLWIEMGIAGSAGDGMSKFAGTGRPVHPRKGGASMQILVVHFQARGFSTTCGR